MDDKTVSLKDQADEPTFWDKHRLSLLLIFTFIITVILTVVSITIYNNSGAAQLDLSRPGYQSVSDKVERDDPIDEYSASGQINTDTIKEFMDIYNKQAEKVKAIDAFNGDPLNPEVLGFE